MFSKKKPGGKHATTVTVGCGIVEYLQNRALNYVEGSISELNVRECSTLVSRGFIFDDETRTRTERDSWGYWIDRSLVESDSPIDSLDDLHAKVLNVEVEVEML